MCQLVPNLCSFGSFLGNRKELALTSTALVTFPLLLSLSQSHLYGIILKFSRTSLRKCSDLKQSLSGFDYVVLILIGAMFIFLSWILLNINFWNFVNKKRVVFFGFGGTSNLPIIPNFHSCISGFWGSNTRVGLHDASKSYHGRLWTYSSTCRIHTQPIYNTILGINW